MAVYTHLGRRGAGRADGAFDVGSLVSAKGIAEGVSNSNWLIETDGANGQGARFILTMFEGRTEVADLPFFLGLLDHLAGKGCPVPRTIHDRAGASFRTVDGKAVALIEFLPGVSVSRAHTGAGPRGGHRAGADPPGRRRFSATRANTLGLAGWRDLLAACGEDGLATIDPRCPRWWRRKGFLDAAWPDALPRSTIHADLFPDNVLMLGERSPA
jgi:homoserine kinase type II